MTTITTSEETLAKRFKSAFTACGFLIAHYLYILANSLFNFYKYGDGTGCLLYASLAALFIWLFKKLKKEQKFQNLLNIIIIYFCERCFTFGQFCLEEDYGALALQFVIFAPIAFFLIKGFKASVDLMSAGASKVKKVKEAPLIGRPKASKKTKTKKVASA